MNGIGIDTEEANRESGMDEVGMACLFSLSRLFASLSYLSLTSEISKEKEETEEKRDKRAIIAT